MVTRTMAIDPSSTFVVRFWWEGAAGRPHWRGNIEHVQSGTRASFLDLERMLTFLGQYGIQEEGGRAVEQFWRERTGDPSP